MKNFESIHINEELFMVCLSAYEHYQNQYNKIMRNAIGRSGLNELSSYLFRGQDNTLNYEELAQQISDVLNNNLYSFLYYKEAETMSSSIQNLTNALSSLRNKTPQIHPLYNILENTNQNPASMMLSMMSFHSMMKTVFQAIDIYSKARADNIEIEILTNAERYLTCGVSDYLRMAKDFAMGCAFGNWNFAIKAANLFVYNSLGHKAGNSSSCPLFVYLVIAIR
ncbi:MAG: hypothetical protein PUG32_00370 [Bacteroidales bacterium]|nr:hypothetical protein [Bacteroidales bacterium]